MSTTPGTRPLPAGHSALLTVGASIRRVAVDEKSGGAVVGTFAPLALSFDGRAIEEETAAAFLDAVKRRFSFISTFLSAGRA